MGWPSVEVDETDNEVKVVAELPGLEEKEVQVELANGILRISGLYRRSGLEGLDGETVWTKRHARHAEIEPVSDTGANARAGGLRGRLGFE
jgi:HSP20 family protein